MFETVWKLIFLYIYLLNIWIPAYKNADPTLEKEVYMFVVKNGEFEKSKDFIEKICSRLWLVNDAITTQNLKRKFKKI